MPREAIHRFERKGRHYAIDPETCFCFECDAISREVLALYPETPINRIVYLLKEKYDPKEISEVFGELEWLRATESILKRTKPEDFKKAYQVERGLRSLVVALAPPEARVSDKGWFGAQRPATIENRPRRIAEDAMTLLFGRSAAQQQLRLEFIERGELHNRDVIEALCVKALRAARLAGKELSVAVHVTDLRLAKLPPALEGHTLGVKLELAKAEDAAAHINALAKAGFDHLGRLVKAIQPKAEGVSGRVVVRPNHPDFGGAVQALREAGVAAIELDLDSAYVANPQLKPEDMLKGLADSAVYYAESLLKGELYRVDPIATLFKRIYDGAAVQRSDPAGLNELAVDEAGGIYPSWRFMSLPAFRLGSVEDAVFDAAAQSAFEDVGALTTAACRTCWVRGLCGGGTAAVHHALTGSHRSPDAAWCEAQRTWMGDAVAAFNILSSEGVNFSRLYQGIAQSGRPSLFSLVRAALKMSIALRPIEESDAPRLVRWENWAEAAYFLQSEKSLLLATQYDREMDSLHPLGIDQEMMLVRKTGAPFGLLKVRPQPIDGAAQLWVYMPDAADYAAPDIRRSFEAILEQTAKAQQVRRVTAFAAANETGLHAFFEATGLQREGVLREALYLHGQYRDVHVFGRTLN